MIQDDNPKSDRQVERDRMAELLRQGREVADEQHFQQRVDRLRDQMVVITRDHQRRPLESVLEELRQKHLHVSTFNMGNAINVLAKVSPDGTTWFDWPLIEQCSADRLHPCHATACMLLAARHFDDPDRRGFGV